jgi:alpha-tubulin suppressor-like RCC1 family protein
MRLDPKQLTPGTEGQVVKVVDGVSTYGNNSLSTSDKNLMPTATSGSAAAAGLATSNDLNGGNIGVFVNGIRQSLGDGVTTNDCYFSPGFYVMVSVGFGSSLGISAGGASYAWGNNDDGQLGISSQGNRSSPTSIIGSHRFSAVAGGSGGDGHSLALKYDGSAWSWGYAANGQLGNSATTDRSSPVSVIGGHSFSSITGGFYISQALKSDGTAWGWGENSAGELGNDTVTDRSSPVSVAGNHSFSSISAGDSHGLALKSTDGSAWTWGGNAGTGGLGQGTVTVNRSSPVSVAGGHSFISISADRLNSAGLKSDGSAWTWGYAANGQLGNNATTNRSSPASVVGAHNFVSINIGGDATTALKADGSAWAWGKNTGGAIGDNTTTDRSSPVSVIGGHSFSSVVAGRGASSSFGMKSDGSLWAWGFGAAGNFGNNEVVNRSSPVSVLGMNSPRAISAIVAGDALVWNGTTAGFDLATDDEVNFDYIA